MGTLRRRLSQPPCRGTALATVRIGCRMSGTRQTIGSPLKLSVLALDYDGTIAVEGALDPSVRQAIAVARERGIVVALVTGRRLDDLRRVAGDLSCFDVVVAENGAVLDFPATGRHVVVGRRPRQAFIDELTRRRVPFAIGETIVEMPAAFAAAALDAVRQLEQPLVLAFNRGRLMLLPPAIGKSTGLRQALGELRLSIHNAVGIGDAENDHDLLDACEVGVAVGWGSAALRAVADEVIDGTQPAAVAPYIDRLLQQPRLSAAQMGRRTLILGREYNGDPVALAVRGRTILVAGEPGSGKSWLAGLICEQLILQGYCLCIIDSEGDYRSLETLPGVIMLGGDDGPPSAREIVKALRHPDVSLVVDLSRIGHHEKTEYVGTMLALLNALRRRTGLPHKIVLDEAHYYVSGAAGERLIDTALAGYVLVSYRISGLASSIRATADAVVLVTRETDEHEAAALLAMSHAAKGDAIDASTFRDLAICEAALLPGPAESHGHVVRFQFAPRVTAHVRHRSKYLEMPVMHDKAFLFTDERRPAGRARTLREFMALLTMLPASPIAAHLQRGDFSAWLADVFRDAPLASHVRRLEARAATDDPKQIADEIVQAIRARYEPTPDIEPARAS
jgi:hydroxymethylpyrimidine pyrophosphatase-like HAD family hydrolase